MDGQPEVFRVDLRAVVELLACHVYSSPRVYLRELLQNAVDAVTARAQLFAGADPGFVRILPADAGGDGALLVADNGIGLSAGDVRDFLATIGGSAKRDELALPRTGFIGRFGVGLLSCFVVADRIEVLSRSAAGLPPAWFVGHVDGTYEVGELVAPAPLDDALGAALGPGPGTVVRLAPRREALDLVSARTVEALAATFGAILATPVVVRRPGGTTVDVTDPDPPWRSAGDGASVWLSPAVRAGLDAWCQRSFGFCPLDAVPLRVPAVGLVGVAFVQPSDVHPAARPGHLVYLRRMLLGESIQGLVPDWAFFVRCVVDVEHLEPTASREALMEDEGFLTATEQIGEQLRRWLVSLGAVHPERLRRLLAIHGRAAKGLAAHDPEVLSALAPWLEVETSDGAMTLLDLGARTPTVRYTETVDRFRQLAPIARAQGLLLANGGYTYDADLLRRVGDVVPGSAAEPIEDDDIVTTFDDLDLDRRLLAAAFLAAAATALDDVGCTVELRSFEPEVLPALFLHDPEAARRRQLRSVESEVDPSWAELLRGLDDGGDERPRLVCNDRHPLVARLVDRAGASPELVASAVLALYGQALLLGHRPMRAIDLALHNRALLDLVERAVGP